MTDSIDGVTKKTATPGLIKRGLSVLSSTDSEYETLGSIPFAHQLARSDCVDQESARVVDHVPYCLLYEEKPSDSDPVIFCPGYDISVEIPGREEFSTTHVIPHIFYEIEFTHGPYTWTVNRRYEHFLDLHRSLLLYRAKLFLKSTKMLPRLAKNRRTTGKSAKAIGAGDGCETLPTAASTPRSVAVTSIDMDERDELDLALVTNSPRHKNKRKSVDSAKEYPEFPIRPILVPSEERLKKRKRNLQRYLQALLKVKPYLLHRETLNFIGVSRLSFVAGLSPYVREDMVLKRSTGGLFAGGCFSNCHARTRGATWNGRWLVLKDTYLAYLNLSTQRVTEVFLFDRNFKLQRGLLQTRVHHGITLDSLQRQMIIDCYTFRKSCLWATAIQGAADTSAKDFTKENRYGSFAPPRESYAGWYVDGSSYFEAVAHAMDNAKQEIFITDYWLSPEIIMKRPSMEGPYWRLDNILARKVAQGVQVFILLYKELTMALGINSYYSKDILSKANVKVMRHPDHVPGGTYLWSHHEKLVVVDQSIAFVGGIDLCYGRWDDTKHRLTDQGSILVVHEDEKEKVPSVTKSALAATAAKMSLAGIATDISTIAMAASMFGNELGVSNTSSGSRKMSAIMEGEENMFRRAPFGSTSAVDDVTLPGDLTSKKSVFKLSDDAPNGYAFDLDRTRAEQFEKAAMLEHDTRPASVKDAEVLAVAEAFLFSNSMDNRELFYSAKDGGHKEDGTDRNHNGEVVPDLSSSGLNRNMNGCSDRFDSVDGMPVFSSEVAGCRTGTSNESKSEFQESGRGLEETVPELDVCGPGCGEAVPDFDECGGGFDECGVGLDECGGGFAKAGLGVDQCGGVFDEADHGPGVVESSVDNREPLLQESETVESSPINVPSITVTLSDTAADQSRGSSSEVNTQGKAAKAPTPKKGKPKPGPLVLTPDPDCNDPAESDKSQMIDKTKQNSNNNKTKENSNKEKPSSSHSSVSPWAIGRAMASFRSNHSEKKKQDKDTLKLPDDGAVLPKPSTPKMKKKFAFNQEEQFCEDLTANGGKPLGKKSQGGKAAGKGSTLTGGRKKHLKKKTSPGVHDGKDEVDDGHSLLHIAHNIVHVEDKLKTSGIEGSSKLWIGKDYINFIIRDIKNTEEPFKDFIDRFTTPRLPWHDIASVVTGTAARDVARHFIQRWNFTKLKKAKSNKDLPLILPKSYDGAEVCPDLVAKGAHVKSQVLRSAGHWSTGISETETSIHQAYVDVILNAEHYIYIENQFFISMNGGKDEVLNGITDALVERITRAHSKGETFRVFIVLPLLPGFEGQVGTTSGSAIHSVLHWTNLSLRKGDDSLLARLEKAVDDPSQYVTVHGLRQYGELSGKLVTELIYVHSKLLIVDDRKVIIGSANINDRSLLGKRDSEVCILYEDISHIDSVMNGKPYQAGRFAFTLRNTLFVEHLGILEESRRRRAVIQDPVSEKFYQGIWKTVSKSNTDIYDEVFKCIPHDSLRDMASLSEFTSAAVADSALCVRNMSEAKEKLVKLEGYLVDYPLNFLIDEVLNKKVSLKEGIVPEKVWT